jgi:SAM-dependent methyltransferase
MTDFSAANRLNWDNRAELHATDETGTYMIDRVLGGGSALHDLEVKELGDVSGKDIVHLQCHIGLDTISLKNIGAKSVTGLDFSPKAISTAHDFAERAGADVRFVEASVYDAPQVLGETYDIVFVTWGAINWLDDIVRWSKVVSALLRPGGRLYLLEGHPQMNQFEARDGKLDLEFDWRTPANKPLTFDDAQTYTGDARKLTATRCYEWIHPLSDVVNAILGAGLALDFLNEHDIVIWKPFPFVVEAGEDQFALPEGQVKIPMSFSIGATKRG